MVAALRLAERGCSVSIYDSADRLGGKAGSNGRALGGYDDHGYHIFPAWYVNIWRLVDELSIRHNFVDRTRVKFLDAGRFPDFRTIEAPTAVDPRRFLRNLCAGVAPPVEWLLFQYAVLDLASQSDSRRAPLDQLSVTGFLRSRFYDMDTIEQLFQSLMLKAVSVSSYQVSSMTVRNLVDYWIQYPAPWFRILRGNLQQNFVAPLQARLEQLGCQIHLMNEIKHLELEGTRVKQIVLCRNREQEVERAVDRLVLAIPHAALANLIDSRIYAAAPRLSQVQYLESRPMAAFNIYLRERVVGIPEEHIFLNDSRFDLTMIDVGQLWSGYTSTVLNVIAADITELEMLPDMEAEEQILGELKRYLPGLEAANIIDRTYQSHRRQPLFINAVGAWHYRPRARQQLANLYLAGDFCRSPVDLACMEGAIESGLRAAEEVRVDAQLSGPIDILAPRHPPRGRLRFARKVLLPAALLLTAMARRQNSSYTLASRVGPG
jgi:uncharacterized protein with NAD-binding domain and iron-sulfur cluster